MSNDSFLIGTARSSRIGPTGDFHDTPIPALTRIAEDVSTTGWTPPVVASCAGVRSSWCRLELIERAEIGEYAPAEAEFLGQPERHAQSDRADIVFLAAEGVVADRIARADAGILKPAQIVAADKEAVLKQHLLAIPAEDIARPRR